MRRTLYCVKTRPLDTGEREEAGPGDVCRIAPGHDPSGVGGEPAIILDFEGSVGFAVS